MFLLHTCLSLNLANTDALSHRHCRSHVGVVPLVPTVPPLYESTKSVPTNTDASTVMPAIPAAVLPYQKLPNPDDQSLSLRIIHDVMHLITPLLINCN